jgi:hypothetical protein
MCIFHEYNAREFCKESVNSNIIQKPHRLFNTQYRQFANHAAKRRKHI